MSRTGGIALNAELAERGELVDAQGLAGPEQAKFVVASNGTGGAPVVTDGPYPESKELLAGYRIVDVESGSGPSRSRPRSRLPRVPMGRRSGRPSRSARS